MNLSIRGKIALATLASILLVSLFIGFLLRSEDALARLMTAMIRDNIASMRAAEEIKYNFLLYDDSIFRYLVTDKSRVLEESADKRQKIHEWIRTMKNLVRGQTEQDLLAELEDETSLYERDVKALLDTYRKRTPEQKRSFFDLFNGPPAGNSAKALQKQAVTLLTLEGGTRLTRIYSLTEKLADISSVKLEEAEGRVQATAAATKAVGLAVAAAVLGALVLVAIFLSLSLLQPLRDLLQGVRKVTGGDLALELDPRSTDEIGQLTVSFNTMTRRLREKQERLIAETVTDPLTELYNLRYFQAYLGGEVARATRYQRPFTLLILDIDHFKHYNDHNGHQMGNVILKQVATILKESLRADGTIARYGGEEFVIGLPETDRKGGQAAAERLRATIEKASFPGEKDQPGGRLTVSIGGATFPADGAVAQQLIEKADQALYAAKAAGRNHARWSAA